MNAFLSKLEKLHNLLSKGNVFAQAMKTFGGLTLLLGELNLVTLDSHCNQIQSFPTYLKECEYIKNRLS